MHLALSLVFAKLFSSLDFFQANKVSQYRFVCLLYKLNTHLNALEQEHLQLVFILFVLGSQEVSLSCKVVLFTAPIASRDVRFEHKNKIEYAYNFTILDCRIHVITSYILLIM